MWAIRLEHADRGDLAAGVSGRVGSERHALAILAGLAPPASTDGTDDTGSTDGEIASVTELASWIAEANR